MTAQFLSCSRVLYMPAVVYTAERHKNGGRNGSSISVYLCLSLSLSVSASVSVSVSPSISLPLSPSPYFEDDVLDP